MAFIPAPNTWRVAINFSSLGGNSAANVIHVEDGLGVMSSTRAQELADIVENWIVTTWSAQASNQWRCDTIEVADASSQVGASASASPAELGTLTSNPLPSQDTVAVSLRTGFMGRSNRGRLYHVGLVEDSIVDGLIAPSPAAAIVNLYQTLRSDLLADDFEWVVTSYQFNGVPRVTAENNAINDIFLVDNKVDRQLRRKKS